MGTSNAFKDDTLNWSLGRSTPTQPNQTWVALVTTLVTDADTGSTIVEPTYGEYNRVQVPTPAGWTVPQAGTGSIRECLNVNNVDFPEVLTGAGQTVVGYAILDAAVGGRVLSHGASPNLVLNVNTVPQFAANDLKHQVGSI